MDSESAFKALKSEIKANIRHLQTEGSEQILNGNYAGSEKLIDQAKALEELQKQIGHVQQQWKKLLPQPTLPGITPVGQRNTVPVTVGVKTHEKYFYLPILKALVELGGSGPTKTVIDRVGEMLADRLNDYDKQVLTNGHSIRWRSTTAFVRLKLVQEGLMSKGSPEGKWEISKEGREYLEKYYGRSLTAVNN